MQIVIYDQDEDYEVDRIDLSRYDLDTDSDMLISLMIETIQDYIDTQE